MSSFENVEFFDEDALLDRLSEGLSNTKQEVVFVVGAPMSAPEETGQAGVSSVAAIVEEVRKHFPESSSARVTFENTLVNSPNQYQAAFQFLQGRRGQGACNAIIRDAVLKARIREGDGDAVEIPQGVLSAEDLSHLDEDIHGWHLTRGVEALGGLIAAQPQIFGKMLLTSNFDPLVKVSIRQSGGSVWQTSLINDADLGNSSADGCRIVHFHGYWHGTDTLHTGAQLLQSRPTLKSSLLEELKDKLVVVIAYGGWQDILTSALKDLTENTAAFPEILWTFYDSTPVIPSHLRTVLEPGMRRGRTNLYAGIDCHSFFPKLLDRWNGFDDGSAIRKKEYPKNAGYSLSATSLKQLECDRPPNIEAWVGREAELRSLETTRAPVVILSGIGGQGKSLTAAKHIRDTFASSVDYRNWDWRDCKELADSIRTQVIASIDRISSEETTSEMLANTSDADLADLFIEYAIDAKTIFVFDNVDHYVDLENFRFVGLLDRLVKRFAATETTSQIILTCRPQVKYAEVGVVTIPMPGLSLTETEALFDQRSVSDDAANAANIRIAHEMTKGHPFWLDLIAVQVAHVPGTTLDGLLEDLRRGREESPNILSSIWSRLPEREQVLLRTMAEAVRPETKETLESYVSAKLRYNKFSRALTSLIKLNLVVVKPELNSPDLYDLHPLVRQFVRQTFSRSERMDYISLVIGQYEMLIGSLRKALGYSLPFTMLGRWTQKAELEIEAQRFQSAASSLTDATDALIGGGHSEEFVRVARSFLETVDWHSAHSEIDGFDNLVEKFVECLDELGDFDGANAILDRFAETIPEKTARYIHYCDMRSHSFWKRGEFSTAVEWGEKGLKLKKATNVDTVHGSEHNLALARRDSGDIDPALEYFAGSTELAELTDPISKIEIENGPKHGNVGRCLQLKGDLQGALVCYKKSLKALENSADYNRLSNRAYARQWIAECSKLVGELRQSLAFAVSAESMLTKVSPSRAEKMRRFREEIQKDLGQKDSSMSVPEAERVVEKWSRNKIMG